MAVRARGRGRKIGKLGGWRLVITVVELLCCCCVFGQRLGRKLSCEQDKNVSDSIERVALMSRRRARGNIVFHASTFLIMSRASCVCIVQVQYL